METFFGIILGGGFLAFLQFLISRHDKKHDRLAGIVKEIEGLRTDIKRIEEKGEHREAVNSRVRILRFGDELLEGRSHSKDSYDQVLSDITNYKQYCEKHPDFENEITVATVSHIRKMYQKRLEKHDFLGGAQHENVE